MGSSCESSHSRFSDITADVIFLSSDKPIPTRFYIHSKNLEVSSGAFPPVIQPASQSRSGEIKLSTNDPVPLSEPAHVLETIFSFMYPQDHPDLEGLPIEELAPIAKAAEKYQVYPALVTCKNRMKSFIMVHPIEVGAWAARHGHNAILDEAAPRMLYLPLARILGAFPGHLVIPWAEYHDNWTGVRSVFLSHSRSLPYEKDCWDKRSENILRTFHSDCKRGKNPFIDLDELFLVTPEWPQIRNLRGRCCQSEVEEWRKSVQLAIQRVPNLSVVISETGTQ